MTKPSEIHAGLSSLYPEGEIKKISPRELGGSIQEREQGAGKTAGQINISDLAEILGAEASDALRRNLRASGIRTNTLLLRGKSENISDSARINLRIDAVDPSAARILKSFFVLTPHNEEEVFDTTWMAGKKAAAEVVTVEGDRAARTRGGDMIVTAHPMENRLDNIGFRISSLEEAAVYGRKMAELADSCIQAEILYDFKGVSPPAGAKFMTRRTKGRSPLQHCILAGVRQDLRNLEDMQPILLDWGGAIHIYKFKEERARAEIVEFIKGVMELIHVSTMPEVGNHALFAFISSFGIERGNTAEHIMGVLRRRGEVSYSALIEDAWKSLCGVGKKRTTAEEKHWSRIRDSVIQLEEEVAEPTLRPLEEAFVHQITHSSRGVVDRGLAVKVVRDFSAVGNLEEVSTFHYNRGKSSINVYSKGAGRPKLAEYHVRTNLGDDEFEFLCSAANNKISERVAAIGRRRRQIISRRVYKRDSIASRGRKLSAEECVSISENIAGMLNDMINDNVYVRPADYAKNGFIGGEGKEARFRLRLVDPASTAQRQDVPEVTVEVVKEHIKALATLFSRYFSYGPQAWKVFESTFPAIAWNETLRALSTQAREEAKEELMQSRTYKRFFEDAERALYVKGDARRVHSQWVDYARKRQTAVVLHPSTLDELKAREGQIADVVRTLYQAGSIQDAETKADIPFSIEDAVADINHVHIAFEGNGLDITSQAIEGAFKIKRGFYIVHPFSCERLNHRFADYVDSNIAIPFDENSLGTPFFMPESQYSKLFRPLFFTAKIVEGDKYSVGDERRPQLGVQEFDVLWNTNFFGQEGRTTRDLERRLEESDLVAKLEHLVLTSYPKGAARVRILETIMSRLQTLSGGERRGFISDIYDLINPNNPEFFDDRFPHLSFSVYQELPELLDAKVETSYPHLAERLSELFTLEDAIEHVYQREKEIGARLTEREQEELLKRLEAEGKVKRVRIGGSKPCEYIKDIAYMRDTSHYVIKMTIETDSGPREVIVKRSEPRRPKEPTSDLLNEVVPSTILMHLRDSDGNPVRTPMIVALDAEYGVESFAPGKKISKCSEDLRRRYAKKIAFFLGMDARVADLCGDCHNNNVLVSEDGGVTRIDLERIVPRWVDDIGHKDVGYYANSFEFQILSMLLPQWGDRPNPERIELWNCFIDGLNAADTQLRDPVVRSEIEETIKRLDRLYPPKRTGLTSTYKARLKKTLDETTVEDIIKRIAKINYDTYTWAMENSPDMRYRSEINFWERYI